METDNPRDIFPTGKNPDYGGSKKRYPPNGKILTEDSQAVNLATLLVRPERCGLACERNWQHDAGSIYGKKGSPTGCESSTASLEATPADWGNPRRFLRSAKWKRPGMAFFTDSWMRRWGTRATPTGPSIGAWPAVDRVDCLLFQGGMEDFFHGQPGFCPLDAALAGCECAAAATAEGGVRAAGGRYPKALYGWIVLECYRHRSMSTLASSSKSDPIVRCLGRPGTGSCCVSRCNDHLPMLTAPR